MKHSRFWILATLCVAGSCFSSTARADDPNIAAPTSFLRVLHGVSGGPKVDVYVDGEKKLNDVEFAHITKYLRVRSGYHNFRIVNNDTNRNVWAGTRNLLTGRFYTLGTYGTRYRVKPFLADDTSGNPGRMQGRLTIYQFSPNSQPIDVYGYTKTGRVYRYFRRVRYGQIKPANVRPVPMTLRLVANRTVIKTENNFDPRAGRHYAAYVLGEPGKNFVLMVDKTASQ